MEPVSGHLEVMDKGFGFLRDIEHNFNPGPLDTFVPANFIRQHRLDEGLFIKGRGVKGDPRNENLKLTAVDTVNGIPMDQYHGFTALQDCVSIDPNQPFNLTLGPDDTMGQALDLIVPMGLGQRGLVISPPKSGKTTILKHLATAIMTNHPGTQVFVLLVDERPEEVTDFKRGLSGAHVLASSADRSLSEHIRMTRLGINTVVRATEAGDDVVLLIDSLTRLSRAFNTETASYGRTMSGGLGANALEIPRRVFGAARNIENGGSLTIMATILVDTGSRMDEIIFQEFKGTGNLDLALSRKCAEQRVWPAININDSGTRKEHLILDKQRYGEITEIRRSLARHDEVTAMQVFIELLKSE